ncbi:MAG: peptidylprolyl isomerase, partial [Moorea sp. SIO2I5]|nr:peptidylprolyl isomerase [Moorena sp. SIO2I5]
PDSRFPIPDSLFPVPCSLFPKITKLNQGNQKLLNNV